MRSTKVLSFVQTNTQRMKCQCLEFSCSVFSHIRTECGDLLCKSVYSARMWENTNQKNSEYGHYSRSDNDSLTSNFTDVFTHH